MDVTWTAKFNPKTGEALYFDNKGNISFRPPEGFEEAAAPPPPTRMSFMKKPKQVKLVPSKKPTSKKKGNSKRKNPSSNRQMAKGASNRNLSKGASKRNQSKKKAASSKRELRAAGEPILTDEERSELFQESLGGSSGSKRSKKASKRSKRAGGSKKSKRKKNGESLDDLSDAGDSDFDLSTIGGSSRTVGNSKKGEKRLSANPKYNKTPPKSQLQDVVAEGMFAEKVDNSMDIYENKLADASVIARIQQAVPVYMMEEKYTFEGTWTKKANPPSTPVFKWAPYAHNLGFFTAALYVFFGAVSLLWTFQLENPNAVLPDDIDTFVIAPLFVGAFVFPAGIFMFVFEKLYGLSRSTAIDGGAAGYLRAGLYIGSAFPAFFGYATIMPGVVSLFCGFINILSTRARERGKMRGAGYVFSYFDWEEDRGVYYLSMTYVALNVMVFVYLYGQTAIVVILCFNDARLVGDEGLLLCPSQAAPIAKGFGNMLNLNCSLLIIPILRGILTTVTEKYNKNNVFPIRKAIEFHQIIGSITGIAVFGHTAAHYINYIFASSQTIDAFGKGAWYTGAAIIVVMAVLYSGAHSFAKKNNYEVFWYSHHTYSLFFLLLLAHGPKFWQWFFIPVIGLTYEKITRHRDRMQRKITVKSVEFTKPVLNINFTPDRIEKFDFREGQYCYILCPQVNNYQWHPFSISSCKGDLERFGYVSLHIRVQDDVNSWTYMLHEYFRQISGNVAAPLEPFYYDKFHRFDANGKRLEGLYAGPDGRPLIRIDGPYNAPCQTYSSFRDVILVGSGIGITPGASVLRSILRYKWSKGFYPDTVRFAWVLRQSEAQSFAWFIELLVDLMAQVKADRENGVVAPGHYLQINLYVTGAKKIVEGQGPPPPPNRVSFIGRNKLEQKVVNSREMLKSRKLLDDKWEVEGIQGPGYGKDLLGFGANDLFQLIQNPSVPSSQQGIIDPSAATAPNRLDDIWVWSGRPDWGIVFGQTATDAKKRNARIREARAGGRQLDPDEYALLGGLTSEVGVCFCGGKAIGRDLKLNTKKNSSKEIEFHLNEEFF